jgi:biotin transport system substrate-specific component
MRPLRSAAVPAPQDLTLRVAGIVAGSMLMALGAHVAVPVPWSPIPVTCQTLALPLVVALLGARGATLSLVLYLGEGVAGLPVFAPVGGGALGIASLFGPSAGYLIAFPIAAYAIGRLFEAGLWPTFFGRAAAIALGSAVVLAGGAAWLAHFMGIERAIALGVAPFLIGDALKTLLAAGIAPWVRASGLFTGLRNR